MASQILLKKSTTANAIPTTSDLVVGEVAVNTEDKRLFTKDFGGSIVELGTTPSSITTDGTVEFGSLSDGTISVTAFADEDDMSSNSATLIPTQQSVKAYVDSAVQSKDQISELTDVTITSPANNEVLAYDTTSSKWINQTPSEANLVSLDGTETLTNKTLTTPKISQISNTGTLTLPTATDTIVGRATTDTLTNKTIDADSNTISNIEVDNFKTGVLDTDLSTVAATDTTLASAKAIKSYVDSAVQSKDALSELGDVTITTVGDNEVLQYDSASNKWINQTFSEAGIQPADSGLSSIAGLTTAANKMIYTTASDTYAVTDLSSFGRSLIDDADASAGRSTLGLGTAATANSSDFDPAGTAVALAIALG